MKRTQIYLSDDENKVLASEAKKSGQSKSQLIRKAIAACYLGRASRDSLEVVLRKTAGTWRHQVDPVAHVDRLRSGRLARQHR